MKPRKLGIKKFDRIHSEFKQHEARVKELQKEGGALAHLHSSFKQFVSYRTAMVTPVFDHSCQDINQNNVRRINHNGMSRFYRRFRRTNYFVFCYERDFHKHDLKAYDRPAQKEFLVENFNSVFIDMLASESRCKAITRQFIPYSRRTTRKAEKDIIGDSGNNTLFMKDGMLKQQVMGRISQRTPVFYADPSIN